MNWRCNVHISPLASGCCLRNDSQFKISTSSYERQLNRDPGTIGLQVLYSKITTVLFGNPMANAESQSGALAGGLSGVESVQSAAQIGETRAAVFYFDDGLLSILESADRYPLVGNAFQRIAGIIHDIEQDLLQFIF